MSLNVQRIDLLNTLRNSMGKGFRMSVAEMIYVGLSWEETNVLGLGARIICSLLYLLI